MALALSCTMYRRLLVLGALVLAAQAACANDLKQFYELAQTQDTTLQAAHFQRDALVEARPQAIAQWLPQISANASAAREREGFNGGPALGSEAADCAISSTATTQRCSRRLRTTIRPELQWLSIKAHAGANAGRKQD